MSGKKIVKIAKWDRMSIGDSRLLKVPWGNFALKQVTFVLAFCPFGSLRQERELKWTDNVGFVRLG